MTSKTVALAGMALCAVLALTACKRQEAPPAADPTPASAAPPAATAAAPVPAVKPFDPHSVPTSTAAIPPFPYVDLPNDGKGLDGYHREEQQFDRRYVIAGEELRPVEGHYLERWFPLGVARLSMMEAWRNYDTALRAMGAVRIDNVRPDDPAFIDRNGGDKQAVLKRLRLPNVPPASASDAPPYAQYLLRTADKNVWLTFFLFDDGLNAGIVALEEKAMQQSVKPGSP